MLSSMPNVQGHFLQGEAAELVETLKRIGNNILKRYNFIIYIFV